MEQPGVPVLMLGAFHQKHFWLRLLLVLLHCIKISGIKTYAEPANLALLVNDKDQMITQFRGFVE
jgi:hypothetical protein